MKIRTWRAWLSLAYAIAGYGLLTYWFGWRALLCIFLIQWSANLDQLIRDDRTAESVMDFAKRKASE